MANTIKIAGDIRDEFGKGAARRMRVAKLIPATLYAGGDQPTFVKLPMKETTLALLQQMLGPEAQFRDGQW